MRLHRVHLKQFALEDNNCCERGDYHEFATSMVNHSLDECAERVKRSIGHASVKPAECIIRIGLWTREPHVTD